MTPAERAVIEAALDRLASGQGPAWDDVTMGIPWERCS